MQQAVHCAVWRVPVCISSIFQPFHSCCSSLAHFPNAASVRRTSHMYGQCVFTVYSPARLTRLTNACCQCAPFLAYFTRFPAVSELQLVSQTQSVLKVHANRRAHVGLWQCDSRSTLKTVCTHVSFTQNRAFFVLVCKPTRRARAPLAPEIRTDAPICVCLATRRTFRARALPQRVGAHQERATTALDHRHCRTAGARVPRKPRVARARFSYLFIFFTARRAQFVFAMCSVQVEAIKPPARAPADQ